MGNEQLDNLVKVGSLHREPPDDAELAGMLSSGHARITDAQRAELSFESRFDLAYNAAHAFALSALRLAGYRSENRYLVFQALIHTVGLPAIDVRVLDRAHQVRNRSEYEGYLDPDRKLLEACIRVTLEVERRVLEKRAAEPG